MSRRRAVAAAALFLLPSLASAGPWGRPAGGVYAKIGYGYLKATELATPDGTLVPIPAFQKHEANLYVEYGLTDVLTAGLDAIVYRESSIEGFDSAGGVGDLRLGLQSRLGGAGSWLLAARGVIQAPTGDVEKGEGLLPTGSGVWEGELYLSVGRSFASGRAWTFAEAGPQFRGGGLRDGLVYNGQVGVTIGNPDELAAGVSRSSDDGGAHGSVTLCAYAHDLQVGDCKSVPASRYLQVDRGTSVAARRSASRDHSAGTGIPFSTAHALTMATASSRS